MHLSRLFCNRSHSLVDTKTGYYKPIALGALPTYGAFQIAFCCFSSDSAVESFLHVALNSFRKHCSNVLSTTLLLFAIKSYDICFHHKTKCKAADKTTEQRF